MVKEISIPDKELLPYSTVLERAAFPFSGVDSVYIRWVWVVCVRVHQEIHLTYTSRCSVNLLR